MERGLQWLPKDTDDLDNASKVKHASKAEEANVASLLKNLQRIQLTKQNHHQGADTTLQACQRQCGVQVQPL